MPEWLVWTIGIFAGITTIIVGIKHLGNAGKSVIRTFELPDELEKRMIRLEKTQHQCLREDDFKKIKDDNSRFNSYFSKDNKSMIELQTQVNMLTSQYSHLSKDIERMSDKIDTLNMNIFEMLKLQKGGC